MICCIRLINCFKIIQRIHYNSLIILHSKFRRLKVSAQQIHKLKEKHSPQMQAAIFHKNMDELCSIDQFDIDSNKEEMLLYSAKNQEKYQINQITEEKEESVFDYYITPFSQKDRQSFPRNSHTTYKNYKNFDQIQNQPAEATTITKQLNKNSSAQQNYLKEKDFKIRELNTENEKLFKKLTKKNELIKELKDEIQYLTGQFNIHFNNNFEDKKNSSHLNEKANINSCNHPEKGIVLYHQREELAKKKQLEFILNNNQDLYQQVVELTKIVKNTQNVLNVSLLKSAEIEEKYINILNQNKQLKAINTKLLKNTENFISKGEKEIKMFSQFKNILVQKNIMNMQNLREKSQNRKSSQPQTTCSKKKSESFYQSASQTLTKFRV